MDSPLSPMDYEGILFFFIYMRSNYYKRSPGIIKLMLWLLFNANSLQSILEGFVIITTKFNQHFFIFVLMQISYSYYALIRKSICISTP